MQLVLNSAFTDAMQAVFPVVGVEQQAIDFTDPASWKRNKRGGYYRWHRSKGYSVYRTHDGRYRWLVRVVEDEPGLAGESYNVYSRQQTYFSNKSFATVQDAIDNIAGEYLGM